MNSSTSNSRKIYLKIFLVLTLGMAVSMVPVRLFTYHAGAETVLDRVMEARAALPKIVAGEEDLVMVFGSSMTDAGFSARQFDRQLAERGVHVKSFNFGFGGLNPYFQDYLSRRVREAFEAGDKRLSLALIEFVPLQVTGARFNGALPVLDSFLNKVATPEELWQITLRDPKRGLSMFNIRYIRNNVSAEMITYFLGQPLHAPRPRSQLPRDKETTRRRREIGEQMQARLEEDFPDYKGEDWVYEWQGSATLPEERSASTVELYKEYYATRRTPRRMENDKFNRIACCDIESLHFEEELIASFIRMVKNFQQFSDHVEVILLPRNTEWIQYSPEAAGRLAAVLQRVRDETGVTIRDYQLLEGITPEMFSDTTHLARYSGDVFFTSHLVEEYVPVLTE